MRNEARWMKIFSFYEEFAYSGIGDDVQCQSAILHKYLNDRVSSGMRSVVEDFANNF